LKREQTVKYLSIYVDKNLKWKTHFHLLSLQLIDVLQTLFIEVEKILNSKPLLPIIIDPKADER